MPWRARCRETVTAGSPSSLEKRTRSNHGSALQADSTTADALHSFSASRHTREVSWRPASPTLVAGLGPAELLEQASHVHHHPMLHDLGVADPQQIEHLPRYSP